MGRLDSWVFDDGGRSSTKFTGETTDCVVRAIAIATGTPYAEVYQDLNMLAQGERPRKGSKRSSSRTGVYRRTYERYLLTRGWKWTPTMGIGTGCRVHLRSNELPAGRLVVSLSKHVCVVIDGVAHDTHDPTRDGTRCVYGYYQNG